MRILVVEDDSALREGLHDLLEAAGHEVLSAGDGAEAVRLGCESAFDLVLLDLMLPRLSGAEACARLRTARPGLPILMLTARASRADKVAGLRAGADDYVTKPFAPEELLARIEAFGRRQLLAPRPPERLEAGGCVLDLSRYEATRDGVTLPLTPREAGMLRWLHRHRERAVTRAELLEHVWGVRGDLETRTVDVAIAKLRQKVERDPSNPRVILSVQGVGYAWGPSAAGPVGP